MLNTLTVSQPLNLHKRRSADAIKRRILKYYDLLPPEAQDEVKKSIADRHSVHEAEQPIQVDKVEQLTYIILDVDLNALWSSRFPDDTAWHLQALLGESVVNEVLNKYGGQLTERAVSDLLTNHPLPLYTDAEEKLLFLGINKLAERELGPLKPISATSAAMQYGLSKLEEASEKSYVRL